MASFTQFGLLSLLAASALAAPAGQFGGFGGGFGGSFPKASSSTSTTTTSPLAKGTPITSSVVVATSTPVVKTTLATTTTAAVVKSSTTKVATSTAAAATTAAVASSGKRGLAYNDASYASLFSSASEVTWAYNWGQYSGSIGSALNYVPLLWGTGSDFTSGWSTAATYEISVGATHLMSFNEPDLSSQSNLSPAAAASAYMTYMQPFAGSAKLGSPAVTNGGSSSMGLNWLSTFFTDCSSCQIDFVPIHWYNNVGTNQDFKDHITAAHAQTGKPIWVTEFGLNSPATDAQIIAFLEDVLPWMDEQSFVERYSYFMVAENYLVDAAGDALSAVGTAYIS